MLSVNNCLMSNNSDANDIALEKIKNVLIMFEKKKRNLDKRKTKLEDYKRKTDLNEDQQLAVSKYPEVVSNLELLEEFTTQTASQFKEADKALKKVRKAEKLEKKRNDASMLEFTLSSYSLLNKLGLNQQAQTKLVMESTLEESDIRVLNELFTEVKVENSDWKRTSEIFQSLHEGGDKKLELSTSSGDKLIAHMSKDNIILIINKMRKIEWLNSIHWEECIIEPANEEVITGEELYETEEESCPEQVVESEEPEKDEVEELIHEEVQAEESHKMNFVFLHESIVQKDTKSQENGYKPSDELRPSSQMSGKSNSNDNNTAWHTVEDFEPTGQLEDVFSSATQSEFMHSENFNKLARGGGNIGTRGSWQGGNVRYRGGGGGGNSGYVASGQNNGNNYWRSSGNRPFNSNNRFPRQSRGNGGRGRGAPTSSRGGVSGRIDSRYMHSSEPLSAQ